MEFEPNNLPNEKERKTIFDLTKRAGLKEVEIINLPDMEVWYFNWSYWRFTEKDEAVCEQLEKRIDHLVQYCKSNIRLGF